MNFPLYIAKRYLQPKNSTNAINIITIIAMFGVIVGSLVLFIILSGFSGLRTFSYSLLNTSDPDIKITKTKGKSFTYTSKIEEELHANTNIASFSKVIEERVFLKYKNKEHTAYIKGVDADYKEIIQIDSSFFWAGSWIDPEFKNTAVVGVGIMAKLSNLSRLDFIKPLQIYVPKPGKGYLNPNNAFNVVETQIIGVYRGREEFHNKYVFTELEVAQKLLNYTPNKITAIEIKLHHNDTPDVIVKQLQEALGSEYTVKTRAELNALIHKVINTENFVSYLIFTLIVIIALFNIIGAIIMMIIDKRKDLKTLLNLGASVKEIKQIFVLQGFLLIVIGLVIGLLLGIILVFLQQKFGWFHIAQGIPYPVEFHFKNGLIVALTIVILGFLAAKIAGSRISKEFIES